MVLMDVKVNETRAVLLLAAAAFGVYLLMCAAVEAARAEQSAEQAVFRAHVAGWEINRLLQEARDITAQAALRDGTS
jgi:hypothetical protein